MANNPEDTTCDVPTVQNNEETAVDALRTMTSTSPAHHLRNETTDSQGRRTPPAPLSSSPPAFVHSGSPPQASAEKWNITVPELVNLVLASIGVISTVTISVVFGVYTVRFGDDTNKSNAASTQSTFDATTSAETTLLQIWYGNRLALLAFCQAYPNVNNASCPHNSTVAAQQLADLAANIASISVNGPASSSATSTLSMGAIIGISYICVTVVVSIFVFLLVRHYRHSDRAPRENEKERGIS